MSIKRSYIVIVGISLLLIHFTFIMMYSVCTPLSKLKTYSQLYVYPIFHQSWQVFVPPPKQNYQLFVRVKENEKWRQWTDVFSDIIQQHKKNPVKGNELLMLTFSNTLRYSSAELTVSKLYDGALNSTSLNSLYATIYKYIKNQQSAITAIEFIVKHTEPEKPVVTCYFKNLPPLD